MMTPLHIGTYVKVINTDAEDNFALGEYSSDVYKARNLDATGTIKHQTEGDKRRDMYLVQHDSGHLALYHITELLPIQRVIPAATKEDIKAKLAASRFVRWCEA